jgi:hypothetical protein
VTHLKDQLEEVPDGIAGDAVLRMQHSQAVSLKRIADAIVQLTAAVKELFEDI